MTIDDIYEQVIQAGPGCTITKRDIKDAFRIVPVAEDNQYLLAFQWNDSTYVGCCLPFGLATAPFLFNPSPKLSIGYSNASSLHSISIIT
ncbi:hypothetical protein N7505_001387 [Penicillium chrysogenum]|uniref:Uncharacterized protein n=1 Tax=Penicillium chrysogenum TaxID=5076 RepID=A0ABQ8WWJ0_PENCH|nr:hypothetical protein N7505_001387 [Penicillium chrysogenum]